MNLSKSLNGISKISIETNYLVNHNIKELDLLSGVLCVKSDSSHIMVRNPYDSEILTDLNDAVFPTPDKREGNFINFSTIIYLNKVPEEILHISTNLMMYTRHKITPGEILDCFITVKDDNDNIVLYHEFPGIYKKINCITILDIFRDGNYWSIRPICKNIHDISKYLLFGENSWN